MQILKLIINLHDDDVHVNNDVHVSNDVLSGVHGDNHDGDEENEQCGDDELLKVKPVLKIIDKNTYFWANNTFSRRSNICHMSVNRSISDMSVVRYMVMVIIVIVVVIMMRIMFVM